MEPYSIQKRKAKDGTELWYVQFKDNFTGKYKPTKSIKKLAQQLGGYTFAQLCHINKPMAVRICDQAIEKGLDGSLEEDPLFSEYLTDFWNFSKSEYIKERNDADPDRVAIGPDHADNMARNVRLHIIPNMRKGLLCSQVTFKDIEELQKILVKQSRHVWLGSQKALKPALKELQRKGILSRDPFANIRKYAESRVSSVGTMTDKETSDLLRQMYFDTYNGFTWPVKEHRNGIAKVVQRHTILPRFAYLATALSADTGMRKGEILSLRTSQIRIINPESQSEDQALIDVNSAYARLAHFKTPKGKRNRTIKVERWIAEGLLELAEHNPHGENLIFFSEAKAGQPINMREFNKWFNMELERIGITEEERTQRHIVFHSLRHYTNRELRTRIGDTGTQLFMGHTSTRMTDRYDSNSDQRALEFARQIGVLIPNPEDFVKNKRNIG